MFGQVFTRSGYFWLGLNDDSKEGTFAYSDGSKYDYANWGLNEQKKNTESLNCVRSELRTWKGDWSLASCNSTSERNYYVCARKRGTFLGCVPRGRSTHTHTLGGVSSRNTQTTQKY